VNAVRHHCNCRSQYCGSSASMVGVTEKGTCRRSISNTSPEATRTKPPHRQRTQTGSNVFANGFYAALVAKGNHALLRPTG
jgi:hypothetical protein